MFDSSLEGKVVTDDREHALAFVISYELQGFGQDEQKPGGPAQVVYVYRHVNEEAKMEYREMLWSELRERAGNVPLERLVEPAILEKIFGAEAKWK
jgi:outer membrane lipopolysaccharide assembly protein LptE/RlpB